MLSPAGMQRCACLLASTSARHLGQLTRTFNKSASGLNRWKAVIKLCTEANAGEMSGNLTVSRERNITGLEVMSLCCVCVHIFLYVSYIQALFNTATQKIQFYCDEKRQEMLKRRADSAECLIFRASPISIMCLISHEGTQSLLLHQASSLSQILWLQCGSIRWGACLSKPV